MQEAPSKQKAARVDFERLAAAAPPSVQTPMPFQEGVQKMQESSSTMQMQPPMLAAYQHKIIAAAAEELAVVAETWATLLKEVHSGGAPFDHGGHRPAGAAAAAEKRAKGNPAKRCATSLDASTPPTRSAASLEEAVHSFKELAQDPMGCKRLKAMLRTGDSSARHAVINAALPDIPKMSLHQHGHSVVLHVLDIASHEQCRTIAGHLAGLVLRLSKDKYGCWVVQKMMEVSAHDVQASIAMELEYDVLACIESMHGNHVIQKCVEFMPPEDSVFIVEAIVRQTEHFATHKYGCRVVQRLLEHCLPQQLQRLLDELLARVPKLASSAYGNYILQHLLEFGRPEDKATIVENLRDDVETLTTDRYASIIVEKCFVARNIRGSAALRGEVCALAKAILHGANRLFHRLINDRYGRFVITSMVENCRKEYQEQAWHHMTLAAKSRGNVNGELALSDLKAVLDRAFNDGP